MHRRWRTRLLCLAGLILWLGFWALLTLALVRAWLALPTANG